jgi:hypothetical protein
MPSNFFSEQLLRQAERKGELVVGDIEETLKAHKGDLEMTFLARGTSEELIEQAASDRVDAILDSKQFESGKLFKYSKLTKGKADKYAALRLKGGAFIENKKLLTLLNVVLYKYVKELMGKEGRLKYQTGRLAHSFQASRITSTNTRISLYFRYMMTPYAVFERNSSPNRDPRDLARAAIKNALAHILHADTVKKMSIYRTAEGR